MNSEYSYRPPFNYLIQIVIGFLLGSVLLSNIIIIEGKEWWFYTCLFLGALFFYGYGYLFYKRCFSNLKGYKIRLTDSSLVMPFLDQGVPISIRYSDINDIDLGNYSDTEVLGIISSKGVLEIEKIWMKKKEYNELHKILNEKAKGVRA